MINIFGKLFFINSSERDTLLEEQYEIVEDLKRDLHLCKVYRLYELKHSIYAPKNICYISTL